MNAVHNARDLLNDHVPKTKKSSPTTWQSAMNGATGALAQPAAFDLNTAKSTTTNAVAESFRSAMDKLTAQTTKPTAPPTAADLKLRKTAETLVNKMFVGTMLKSMRSSPFKDDAMSGGKAGEAYAGLFDQNLAEHAGGGIGTKLVDTIVKQFKKSHGDPTQLHVDPKRDVKKVGEANAANAAVHALNATRSLTVNKPTAKRADHAASAVNFAA